MKPKNFIEQKIRLLFSNYDVKLDEFYTTKKAYKLSITKQGKTTKGIVYEIHDLLKIEISGLEITI